MPCSVNQNFVHCASSTYSNHSLQILRLVNDRGAGPCSECLNPSDKPKHWKHRSSLGRTLSVTLSFRLVHTGLQWYGQQFPRVGRVVSTKSRFSSFTAVVDTLPRPCFRCLSPFAFLKCFGCLTSSLCFYAFLACFEVLSLLEPRSLRLLHWLNCKVKNSLFKF